MAEMKQKRSNNESPEEIKFHPPNRNHSTDSTSDHFEEKMEDDVIIEIKAIIEHSEDGPLSSTRCIYRVPPKIRKPREDSYTPIAVSIGPFHHGNDKLQEMEGHKKIYFKRFTKKAMTSLNNLVSFVQQLEPTVRASYSENIKLDKKGLVKVILVDAGFIIELFRKTYKKNLMNDMLSELWLVNTIIKDLLLLENQLPFFFLEQLFNQAFPFNLRGNIPSFLELTYNFFDSFNKQKLEPNPTNNTIKHFTDLLRLFHLQRMKPPRHSFLEAGGNVLLYNARKLQEAGVKFKLSTSNCLLDLKLSGCVLEVPQILVLDATEILFRNMIALEHCHYPYASYITDYALVLDCLIDTNKDVDILIHKEIICNYLGDTGNVTRVFNGLGKNMIQVNFNSEYLVIYKKLNHFYQDPWHKKKATLKRDYCRTPWQTVASTAAIVLLILTFIQTIFSIL